jgi:signal transduction histidine kinase
MAATALLVALLVTLTAPVAYVWLSAHSLEGQASTAAHLVAQDLAPLVARQPRLWRYQAGKHMRTSAAGLALPDLGRVRVWDCAMQEVMETHQVAASGWRPAQRAWAPVRRGALVAGWVEVTMDGRPSRGLAWKILLGAALLGGLLGWLLYALPVRLVRRQARQIEQARQGLVDANAKLQLRVEEAVGEVRQLSLRVVEAQEEERRRIALDLHDGVGQLLTGQRFVLERTPVDNQQALELCTRTLAEIKRIVHDLRPAELERQALPEAIRDLCARFEERSGLATSFRRVGDRALSLDASVCLLRVCQEALQNAGRHAGGSEVGVVLTLERGAATLVVSDDGHGFDVGATPEGVGLAGMRRRLAVLGGVLQVTSSPEEGTRVRAHLPLEAAQAERA